MSTSRIAHAPILMSPADVLTITVPVSSVVYIETEGTDEIYSNIDTQTIEALRRELAMRKQHNAALLRDLLQ